MQAQDFAKFVASQQDAAQDPTNGAPIDWAEVRDQWLKDLDSLHSQIIDFLKEFAAAGSIRYSFTDVRLTEENIGTYIARGMDIGIGRQHVFLEPIGTLLIGVSGRVDAVGSTGRAQLVLVDERVKSAADLISVGVGAKGRALPLAPPAKQPVLWVWKIVSREARRSFVELDKESLFELLMEISGA